MRYETDLSTGLTIQLDDAPVTLVTLTAKQTAINSINVLEASVTPRRLRDAVLGTDNGWLANINVQINQLRAVK